MALGTDTTTPKAIATASTTRRGMTMTTTSPELLSLLWLASPALPVGGFSYSEGLEAAVEAQRITGEAQARDWLVDQLRLGIERAELAVVGAAVEAWRRDDATQVSALNAWCIETRESSELRRQTEQMGRSLTEWLRTTAAGEPRLATLAALRPAPAWPVAFALAGARSGAGARDVMLAFAFGWAENMVAAAIRAVPLGQSAGQRILGALVEAIPASVDRALQHGADPAARQAYLPMLAVLSARHETQYSRIFRS
jgi:urease accessory protein